MLQLVHQLTRAFTAPVRRRVPIGLAVILACLGSHVFGGTLGAAPAYPVKRGPTGRYLVDQQGVPFLIAGESPQAMIGDLSLADAELFFANRQSHGFNTVWINLLCAGYTGCRADGSTFDGIPPFTTFNDLSTPNEAYFARADQVLRLAAQYGFLVILDPAETGSWLSVMQTNGVAKCRTYGQFLGKRYASFDNIVWMHGNDYQDHSPSNDMLTTAVALGIKDFDTRHLQTVELNYLVSSSLDDDRWAPLIDLNAAYTYDPVYVEVLKDYNRPDFLPTFLVESSYEFEHPAGAALGSEPRNLRAQEYWSILSGATGQLYGNHYTWQFIDGWESQLDTPGAVQMAYVTALFQPRAWYALVPDQTHTVVTSGFGTFGSGDYVTAARTPDGQLVIAYVPTTRTLTVDLSQLSGPAIARWYDPAAGTFTLIAGSPFPNAGSATFTTPGPNADGPGNEDWVLVLEARSSFVELTVASSTYRAGDQLEVLLTAFNPADRATRELLVGVLLPDGRTVAYLTGTNLFGGTATLDSLFDLRPLVLMPPGELLTFSTPNPLVAVKIPEGVPPGLYTWFAALITPGALADGSADSGDIDAIAAVPVNLLP